MSNTNIIVVEQAPIIKYSLLAQISAQVKDKIESLNIDTLEPSEETLKTIKDTRSDLSKEFKTLEEQRKMVKEIVLKDYNEFEDNYKRLIADQFKTADTKLKTLVDSVEDGILSKKIDGLKAYFDEQNAYDFLRFEDLGLHIIKSKSDKSIKEEIDGYIMVVAANLLTIDTLQNKERILAKYHMTKDLNLSISQVNLEIQREESIKAQQEARKAQEEQKPTPVDESPKVGFPTVKEALEEIEEFKCTFTVIATKEQLKRMKQFLKDEGIKYE
ncbi:MAG: DUF1351 domain-containing protein [Bacilli bacterium]|nr:DUF1351 domain-containing protein [Bacilli bacterium]